MQEVLEGPYGTNAVRDSICDSNVIAGWHGVDPNRPRLDPLYSMGYLKPYFAQWQLNGGSDGSARHPFAPKSSPRRHIWAVLKP